MRGWLVRTLVLTALLLLAFACRLGDNGGPAAGPPQPPAWRAPARLIDLPRQSYRITNPPSRWEVYWTGLSILFRSVSYAAIGI